MGEQPGIYVHLEMGVQLPKIMSKDRHITYVSKSMRDRASQFPRQLPPTNTNYLNAPAHYQVAHQQMATQAQQPQTQPQQQFTHTISDMPPNIYNRDPVLVGMAHEPTYLPYRPQQAQQAHHIREYYAPAAPSQQQQREAHPEELRLSSRSAERSSHERGSSAPPPLNSSPWDVTSHNSGGEPHVWKALPATPNQFRLGESDMPWDGWNFPMGFNDNNGDDDSNEGGENRNRSREASLRATWGPEFPGEPSRYVQPAQVDDRARGKAKDIQSLASALMTVDNGFEDQWWYQGPRLVHLDGTTVMVPTAVPRSSFHPDHQQSSVGWAVSREEEQQQQDLKYQHQLQQSRREQEQQRYQRNRQRHLSLQEEQLASFVSPNTSFQPISPRSSLADIVSPLSDYPSPLSSCGGLRRSLTTRSDELHI
ncbi:hypothetical protein FVEG_12164 [Fusarium verticillioides 7600]|uniref:Uncharacterized protein n=1 Tax=Gibberella moniliformis (strain M3125 / FGSC 7600) TaxID=334819 RepID=W7MQR8_GIBM7|nr:hypothetical protein FVEG_12164 [Fusarium verticillioides 7600]XP_018760010.1 hypothetical protein FVEG_12164 [Fusarium verticillioides 7600]RBQ65421.1 hypothetical protein FVER14953_12164 [Fusarium verticillioides]EWG53818.1 hypothetical protein FVEG_12164 [Fusarium verticillioides 7600]EWG53819.1 hypothetical protein FVEG_12164 [Fusarium verticillioides 7600]RBQ95190.1 hypothetical protein FVER53263_12164 [Fusarium verticillioides]